MESQRIPTFKKWLEAEEPAEKMRNDQNI